jgi:glutathione peroxidase-family protein
MAGIYDFTVKTIDGKEQSLAEYRGKALTNYGVTFPMFSKIEVNGSEKAVGA